jgi:hypothetical protein
MKENMQEYTFTLTEEEANMVLAALQELPAKVANPLTQKLLEQAKNTPKDLKMDIQDGASVESNLG